MVVALLSAEAKAKAMEMKTQTVNPLTATSDLEAVAEPWKTPRVRKVGVVVGITTCAKNRNGTVTFLVLPRAHRCSR